MLARVLAIPFDEKRLILEALVRLAWVRIQLSMYPPPLAVERRTSAGNNEHSPRQLGLAVERAAKLLPRTTCLQKALAAAKMLRRRGYACELRLGLKEEDGLVAAHAWVEAGGEIILGGSCNITDFRKLPAITCEQGHSHAG